MIFLILNGGERWVNLDQIAGLRRVVPKVPGGGDMPERTEVSLVNGHMFSVSETVDQVGATIRQVIDQPEPEVTP